MCSTTPAICPQPTAPLARLGRRERYARRRCRQHRLDRADSVSAELYRGALRLADNRGLVEPAGQQLALRRRRYRDEVRAVLADLARIDTLETVRLERVLGTSRHGHVADGGGAVVRGANVVG